MGPENCNVIGNVAKTNAKLFEKFQVINFFKVHQVSFLKNKLSLSFSVSLLCRNYLSHFQNK